MDLFIMKRYVGDDESKDLPGQEDHLSTLLGKIKKRKKEKEIGTSKEKDTSTVEEDVHVHPYMDETEKCNSREEIKSKCETEEQDNLSLIGKSNGKIDDDDDDDQEPLKKKRKKKKKEKKLNDLCDQLQLNENEVVQHKNRETKSQTPSGFTIIGAGNFSRKTRVKRVLPFWLARPFIISGNMEELSKTIYDIEGLDKGLVRQLEENNISHFFPVQSEVIPWLLEAQRKPVPYRPCDLCVSAPTGSGKTLAFALPIIQALKPRVMRHIRALIVLPVKDLAAQIHSVFQTYCKGTDLKTILLTGHKSFTSEQEELIKKNSIIGVYNAVDIVIATPGRLVEHLVNTPGFSLKYLKFLVIDEADRIVEKIQHDWLYHVEKHMYGELSGKQTILSASSLQAQIPPPPQKLLFSATLTQDPEKLNQLGLFQPKLFTVVVGKDKIDKNEEDMLEVRGDFTGKYTTPAELTEKICVMDEDLKPLILFYLISTKNWKNVLCFANSQENTHRLAVLLKHLGGGSLEVGEITGALNFYKREQMLRNFSMGKLKVLVSSDALARGIDIPDVEYVVSYDAPKFIKNHIHRIGRTARAGRKGTAVTFLAKREVKKFKYMLQTAGKVGISEEISVEESELEHLEDDFKNALASLKETLQKEEARASKYVKKTQASYSTNRTNLRVKLKHKMKTKRKLQRYKS